jgi:hypothetical protein
MSDNERLIEVQDKKIILSTLWIFVMFSIAYADIIGFIEPGALERIINGETGFELTPVVIVIISLFQMIPITMIVVARLFRRGVNRWLNIAASVLTLIYVFGGGNWQSASYFVFAAAEAAAMLAIIWLAWSWKE